MGSPLLHLSHDNFGTNVAKGIFNRLRNDQTFSDIKLVCDDDFAGGSVMVPAHKVILVASSKFFSKILTGLDQPHLLLYLRGIPHKQLTLLLDFIYTGEVNVLKDDLNAFLSIAGDLKIEGLTSTSTPKQAKSGVSSTPEELIPGRQLTSTPIQASTPAPTSIDLKQLSTPVSTPDLIKKEPFDPSEKPCTTPQSRSIDPKSHVKKMRDSEGKTGVECLLCGKRLLGGSADGARHVVNVHLKGEGWEANNRGIYYSHKKVGGKKLSTEK